jgi:hypothetical protein
MIHLLTKEEQSLLNVIARDKISRDELTDIYDVHYCDQSESGLLRALSQSDLTAPKRIAMVQIIRSIAPDIDQREADAQAAVNARVTAKQAQIAADAAALDAVIDRITDGLDRETIMAMAHKALGSLALLPAQPDLVNDQLVMVCRHKSVKLTWSTGDDNWVITDLNSCDHGSGYGYNTND